MLQKDKHKKIYMSTKGTKLIKLFDFINYTN